MRRAALLIVILAGITVGLLGTGASEDQTDGDYKVRAIFDNASVIEGEDVKIAGVKVGKISDLDVTKDQKAAVVVSIDEDGFKDFRADAECIIRPQSLIGEKFVECTPTQPRSPGDAEAPLLTKIPDGRDGAGQYELPVSQTSSPVDLDLIGNILRRPFRERFSIILNELGTGLAGRGEELDEVIRRANPALRETDKVLRLLGRQNRILANLVTDSDTVIRPLARERAKVADFIVQAGETAAATAERRDDLEADLERLPRFLRELRPTMNRLGALADEATPVLGDLGDVAPDINRFISELGPFTEAATPALDRLGDAARVGGPALQQLDPIVRDLRTFATRMRPVARQLRELLSSLRATGGIERLMDYLFYQVSAINGFDQYGHYLRAGLIVNLCSTYAIQRDDTCSANFNNGAGPVATASRAVDEDPGRDPQLVETDKALRGLPFRPFTETEPRLAEATTTGEASPAAGAKPSDALKLPSIALPGALASSSRRSAATNAPAPARPADANAIGALLDYLLGQGQ